MDIVIEWVSQIIIFLLLAAIIDLLIPATTMRKYIKLVVGLVLLLIFLKPVFHIFNMDIEDAVQSSVSSVLNQEKTENSMENLINMQKSEIQASQDAYILEQMANQLTEIAEDPLHEEFQVEITHIDFFFAEEDISFENLEKITVLVSESNHKKGVVNHVEEVVINTESPVNDVEIEREDIAHLLKQIWELDNKTLIVDWEGGTS